MAASKKARKTKAKPGKRDVPEQRLRLFVEAYTRQPNGAAAAAAAGYKGDVKSRSQQATRLLAREDVQAMIAAVTVEVVALSDVMTREERQRMWTQIARGELKAPVVVGDGVVDMSPPWPVRLAALRDLGKSQGDFVERIDLSLTGRVIVEARMPQREKPPEPADDDV